MTYGLLFRNTARRIVIAPDRLPYVEARRVTLSPRRSVSGLHGFDPANRSSSTEVVAVVPAPGQWIALSIFARGTTSTDGVVGFSSNQSSIQAVVMDRSDVSVPSVGKGMALFKNGQAVWCSAQQTAWLRQIKRFSGLPSGKDSYSGPAMAGPLVVLTGINSWINFGPEREWATSIERLSGDSVRLVNRQIWGGVGDTPDSSGPGGGYRGDIMTMTGGLI